MLNIFKLKKKNNKLNIIKSKGEKVGATKYYPPSTQEWKDSVYTFNKNTNKTLPTANNYIFNLIRSYLNFYNKKMEKKVRLPSVRRWKRRLRGRQIWISKPELKYSNNKIIITVYIYNRLYTFLLKKLSKLKIIWGKKLKVKITTRWKIIKQYDKNSSSEYKNIIYRSTRKMFYKDKYLKIKKKIKYKLYKFNILINQRLKRKYNTGIYNYLLANTFNDKILSLMEEKVNTIFLKKRKFFKYQIMYLRYKQMILLNKLKFKNAYLLPIKYLIQKIYNKKVEFNLVLLKKFNHNSDILAQIVASKIRNRKSFRRHKPLKIIKASVRKSRVFLFNKRLLKRDKTKRILVGRQNYILKDFYKDIYIYKDYLNSILYKRLFNSNIQNIVFNILKNKVISGIRVQASGRITRRIKAQRAQCKVRYKGTLKNIDSTYKGLSATILKGHEKSTVQYTQLSSKRKIGAFGIKGWINAY